MKAIPRARDVVAHYLTDRLGQNAVVTITEAEIEMELPGYGRSRFGKRHTPSCYARRFREIKSDPAALRALGVTVERIHRPTGAWAIRPDPDSPATFDGRLP